MPGKQVLKRAAAASPTEAPVRFFIVDLTCSIDILGTALREGVMDCLRVLQSLAGYLAWLFDCRIRAVGIILFDQRSP